MSNTGTSRSSIRNVSPKTHQLSRVAKGTANTNFLYNHEESVVHPSLRPPIPHKLPPHLHPHPPPPPSP